MNETRVYGKYENVRVDKQNKTTTKNSVSKNSERLILRTQFLVGKHVQRATQ